MAVGGCGVEVGGSGVLVGDKVSVAVAIAPMVWVTLKATSRVGVADWMAAVGFVFIIDNATSVLSTTITSGSPHLSRRLFFIIMVG